MEEVDDHQLNFSRFFKILLNIFFTKGAPYCVADFTFEKKSVECKVKSY